MFNNVKVAPGEMSLSVFCKYLSQTVTYIIGFFLQKIAHEILYKTLMKRVLPTNSYGTISSQHYRALK